MSQHTATSTSFPKGAQCDRTEAQARNDIREIGKPVAAYSYKLLDADCAEITLPALLKAWDGSQHWVQSFKPSRFHGKEGYVYTRLNETFVPSMFGAKIVAVSA
jgi:hypothetical protein